MIKIFIALLAFGLIFFQVQDVNAEWDDADKAFLIAYGILQMASLAQANYIFDNDDEYGEYKPFLTARRKFFLPVYYAGAFLGAAYLADQVSPTRRKILLGAFILVSLDVLSDNMSVGIGFSF